MNDSLSPGPWGTFAKMAWVGRFITFAMILGLLVISGCMVLLIIGAEQANPPPGAIPPMGGGNLFPAIGMFSAVASYCLAGLVPGVIRRAATAQVTASGNTVELPVNADTIVSEANSRLVGSFTVSAIVGQAILEAGAIINLILMLFDERLVIHLPLVAIAIFGLLLLMPSTDKLLEFVESAGRR